MRYSDFVYFKTHLNKFKLNDFQNQDGSNTNISYLKKKNAFLVLNKEVALLGN